MLGGKLREGAPELISNDAEDRARIGRLMTRARIPSMGAGVRSDSSTGFTIENHIAAVVPGVQFRKACGKPVGKREHAGLRRKLRESIENTSCETDCRGAVCRMTNQTAMDSGC